MKVTSKWNRVGTYVLVLSLSLFAGCGNGSMVGTENPSAGQTEAGDRTQTEETETASDAKRETVSDEETETASDAERGTDSDAGTESENSETESMTGETPKPANGELTKLPSKYWLPNTNAGTVVKLEYETDAYGASIEKYAYVYLPYGYDESRSYDVLYCLHGGGGEMDVYFNTSAKTPKTQILFDNMIANGDVDPFIAVSPTYYGGNGDAAKLIEIFCEDELPNDLIPAVEGTYSSYAESTDLDGLKASRDHRAYSGFSMGALSTWYTFVKSLDYFRYFIPISGDCWINGSGNASGAAKLLEQVCEDTGYGEDDFFIYAVTGDQDIACSAMRSQMAAMKSGSPSFHFVTEDSPEGNISFRVQPGAKHDYYYMPLYYYNALPTLWRGEPVYR